MKKVLALVLILITVCSLVACSSEPATNSDNAKIIDYMQENGDTIIESMESAFATSSGLTCTSSWKVQDNGLILIIKINELDNVDKATKDAMQQAYDSMSSSFDDSLKMLQTELPEVKSLTIQVCEKDGDILAIIQAD